MAKEYIALKLGDKNLEEKLELTDNLSAALVKNIAVYAEPDPPTTVLTGKAAAIRAKLVEVSGAESALGSLFGQLSLLEKDLDATLTEEGEYIQQTSKGALDKLSLLPVELKSHGTGTTPPGPIINFRLSPGVNPGEVKVDSDPEPGAISYEHQQIPDITKPDVTIRLDGSSGCRAVLKDFPSGSHVWVQRRALGGKKTGKGPWCVPSVCTVP
jgi:hypothetical protein